MSQTHILRLDAHPSAIDIPATILSLMSRGRTPLAGEHGRPERDKLAQLLGTGALAELLYSDRAITVHGRRDGYEFREA